MLCMCMCMCMRVHMVAQCMCMCMCAQTCMHAHMHIEIRIDVVSQTCELSGVSSDSQFCETKKVKAPLGVRVVRLGVDSAGSVTLAWSSGDSTASESELSGSRLAP